MHCNGFCLHHKAITKQQDSERLIDELVLYILHAQRLSIKYKYPPSSIIAMSQMAWCLTLQSIGKE